MLLIYTNWPNVCWISSLFGIRKNVRLHHSLQQIIFIQISHFKCNTYGQYATKQFGFGLVNPIIWSFFKYNSYVHKKGLLSTFCFDRWYGLFYINRFLSRRHTFFGTWSQMIDNIIENWYVFEWYFFKRECHSSFARNWSSGITYVDKYSKIQEKCWIVLKWPIFVSKKNYKLTINKKS